MNGQNRGVKIIHTKKNAIDNHNLPSWAFSIFKSKVWLYLIFIPLQTKSNHDESHKLWKAVFWIYDQE